MPASSWEPPAVWTSRIAVVMSLPKGQPVAVLVVETPRRLQQTELVDGGLEEVGHVGADGRPLVRVFGRRRDQRQLRPVVCADGVHLRDELGLAVVVAVSSPHAEEASAKQAASAARSRSRIPGRRSVAVSPTAVSRGPRRALLLRNRGHETASGMVEARAADRVFANASLFCYIAVMRLIPEVYAALYLALGASSSTAFGT